MNLKGLKKWWVNTGFHFK